MTGTGSVPAVLAFNVADAVSELRQAGLSFRLVHTSAPGRDSGGAGRVVRQRVAEGGRVLELTVAAEDWRKEV
jgi:hypothetical protein